eukprot:9132605-Pyramimonas_sp.AAC.1
MGGESSYNCSAQSGSSESAGVPRHSGVPRRAATCVTTTIASPRARMLSARVQKLGKAGGVLPFEVDLRRFEDVLPALQTREWLGKLLQARGYKVNI